MDNLDSYLSTLSLLLADRSPAVIGAALVSFQRIFGALYEPVEDEDAHAARNTAYHARWELLHPQYRRICHALPDFDEWSQVVACEVLLHYARCCFEQPADMTKDRDGFIPPRDEDLELLTYKVTQLLHSTNASVVLSASRLLYYLLPASEHGNMITQLAALATSASAAVEDRDVTYILLLNLFWLLQTDSSYQRHLNGMVVAFFPRSDCSVSSFAPGSLALVPPAAIVDGSSAASNLASTTASLANSLGNLGALGQLGQLGNLPALNLAGTNVSAAVSNALTGAGDAVSPEAPNAFHMSTTTLSGSMATDPIFAAKMELLPHIAGEDSLPWLVDELEETVCYEWRECRAMHALKILADLMSQWGGPRALLLPKQGPVKLDKWGVEARLAEITLNLLQNISGGGKAQGRNVSDPFDHPSPAVELRRGIVQGAVRVLSRILQSKIQTLALLQAENEPRPEVAKALDDLQVEMFDLVQNAYKLLYTSDGPAPQGKRIKLVGKRNVTGGEERATLAWMLGESARVEVEVEYNPPEGDAGNVRKTVAELLGPGLLQKAAKNFYKEPTEVRMALVTAAVKIWAHLQLANVRGGGVHPTALVQVDVHTHHLFQQAWKDPNLDLHAHVEQYVALVRSVAAWVAVDLASEDAKSNGDTPLHPKDSSASVAEHVSPESLEEMLFMSPFSSPSRTPPAHEFGSLSLAVGRDIFGTAYMNVPPWVAKGEGVDHAKRTEIEKAKAKAREALVNTPGTTRKTAASMPASAYEYVPDDSEVVHPSLLESQGTSKRASPGTSTPESSTPPLASLAGRMNPKYQDLNSFLDETDNFPPLRLTEVDPMAPAREDEEYDEEYEDASQSGSDAYEYESEDETPAAPAEMASSQTIEAAQVDAAVGSGGWEQDLDSDDYESENDDEETPLPVAAGEDTPSWSTGLEENAWTADAADRTGELASEEGEKNAWA